MKNETVFVSLFSGIGGKSLGFSTYFREALAVDFWDYAVDTFRLNFPETKVLQRDIFQLTAEDIIREAMLKPERDWVLASSPPCPGFSLANPKRSVEDYRNLLYLHTIELIRDLVQLNHAPKMWFIENVPGMHMGQFNTFFKTNIVSRVKSIDYYLADVTQLNAIWHGAGQDRDRVFYVGIPKEWAQAMKITKDNFPWPQGDPMRPVGYNAYRDPTDFSEVPEQKGLTVQDILPHVEFFSGNGGRTWKPANEFMNTLTATVADKIITRDKDGNRIIRSLYTWERLLLSGFPEDYKFPVNAKEKRSPNLEAKGIGNAVPPPIARAFAKTMFDLFSSRNIMQDTGTWNLGSKRTKV